MSGSDGAQKSDDYQSDSNSELTFSPEELHSKEHVRSNDVQNKLKVYDFVNCLSFTVPEFDNCDFSILCDRYPIQLNKNTFRARVLYIIISSSNKTYKLYPDEIAELGLEHITITTNLRRKLSTNYQEFFINGNTTPQEYKGRTYYNYSIEKVNIPTKNKIKQLRERYNITEPSIFIGKHQELILD